MDDLFEKFQTKLGPLPAWQWGALVGGGLLVYRMLQSGGHKSSGVNTVTLTPNNQPDLPSSSGGDTIGSALTGLAQYGVGTTGFDITLPNGTTLHWTGSGFTTTPAATSGGSGSNGGGGSDTGAGNGGGGSDTGAGNGGGGSDTGASVSQNTTRPIAPITDSGIVYPLPTPRLNGYDVPRPNPPTNDDSGSLIPRRTIGTAPLTNATPFLGR